MSFNWSIVDIWQISFEKWKPINIKESTVRVHVQFNKFLKIALLKNFMLSGMYTYSFLWFEFNNH